MNSPNIFQDIHRYHLRSREIGDIIDLVGTELIIIGVIDQSKMIIEHDDLTDHIEIGDQGESTDKDWNQGIAEIIDIEHRIGINEEILFKERGQKPIHSGSVLADEAVFQGVGDIIYRV
ncbi:hypothetical protein DSECCO2_380680 [anaerobic digester metagenome]